MTKPRILIALALALGLVTSTAQAQSVTDFQQVDSVTYSDIYRAILAKSKYADTVPANEIGSYTGVFECLIDGRRSHLEWSKAVTIRKECSRSQPNLCQYKHFTSVDNGRFRETQRGGDWVKMTLAGVYAGAFNLKHADGNTWWLGNQEAQIFGYGPTGASRVRLWNVLEGHTVWQGRQFPLSCRRII